MRPSEKHEAGRPSVFVDRDVRMPADTCEPLRRAARDGAIELHALARGAYPGERLPASWMPGLRSVGYWDASQAQNWGLDWHRNEGLELGFLSAGRVAFATRNEDRILKPGDLTITRPWQRHRVGDPNVYASTLHWLILDLGVRRPNQEWRWPRWVVADAAELQRLTTLLRENEEPIWEADSETRRCFERLSRLVAKPREITMGRIASCVNELLLAVGDMLAGRTPVLDKRLSSSERTVSLFLEELRENPGQSWTLDSMAAACGIRRTAFALYCHRHTNLTPKQYLQRCRLREAARLLVQEPSLAITTVALRCGFVTSQHFATVFGRWAGLAPGEYRKAAAVSNGADGSGPLAPTTDSSMETRTMFEFYRSTA